MKIVVEALDDVAKEWGEQLLELGRGKANLVLMRALNYEGKKSLTKVKRDMREQGTFPANVIASGIKLKQASRSDLETNIVGVGAPLNLSKFGARNFSYGLRAKVWGVQQVYKGGFIVPAYGGNAYHRLTKERGPLEQLWGAGIARELTREGEQTRSNWESMTLPALVLRVGVEIATVLRGF